MMILKPLLRPRRLQPVADLGPYEINVGALSARHVGLTIAVRRGRNILTGPLMHPPAESMTKPFLVLRVGDFDVALHPGAVVMVIPEDYKATITVGPKSEPADSSEQ
ncbi:hypothetical protein [Mycobacterium avium]|nr:hypothetical protein [Mycobacterium avium]